MALAKKGRREEGVRSRGGEQVASGDVPSFMQLSREAVPVPPIMELLPANSFSQHHF